MGSLKGISCRTTFFMFALGSWSDGVARSLNFGKRRQVTTAKKKDELNEWLNSIRTGQGQKETKPMSPTCGTKIRVCESCHISLFSSQRLPHPVLQKLT